MPDPSVPVGAEGARDSGHGAAREPDLRAVPRDPNHGAAREPDPRAVTQDPSRSTSRVASSRTAGSQDDSAAHKRRTFARGRSVLTRASFASFQTQLSKVGRSVKFVLAYYSVCYGLYLTAVTGAGTVITWLLEPAELGLLNSFFLAANAVAGSGLSPVDFTRLHRSVQVATWLLMMLGSPVLLSIVPVALRRGCSRRKARRRQHSGTAFFNIPMEASDNDVVLTTLLHVVLLYWLLPQLLGWLLLWVGFRLGDIEADAWDCLFLSTSAWHNGGLVTLKSGLSVTWGWCSVWVLSVVVLLILLGNTLFPVALRIILHCQRRCTRSEHKRSLLGVLLRYPRTCYSHLFPDYATRWLALSAAMLILVQILAMCMSELLPLHTVHEASWLHMPQEQRVLANIFQAISSRTAGFSAVNMYEMSPTSDFVFMVCMWISVSPVVVVMRSTAREANEAVLQEYNLGGARERKANVGVVRQQLMIFMWQHATLLLLLFFAILYAEEYATSMDSVHSRFIEILFEFCSAYGEVGLSLSSSPWSASGEWCPVAKLALIAVIFLGRLRGLPDSIDPTVRFQVEDDEDCEEDDEEDCVTSVSSNCQSGAGLPSRVRTNLSAEDCGPGRNPSHTGLANPTSFGQASLSAASDKADDSGVRPVPCMRISSQKHVAFSSTRDAA